MQTAQANLVQHLNECINQHKIALDDEVSYVKLRKMLNQADYDTCYRLVHDSYESNTMTLQYINQGMRYPNYRYIGTLLNIIRLSNELIDDFTIVDFDSDNEMLDYEQYLMTDYRHLTYLYESAQDGKQSLSQREMRDIKTTLTLIKQIQAKIKVPAGKLPKLRWHLVIREAFFPTMKGWSTIRYPKYRDLLAYITYLGEEKEL